MDVRSIEDVEPIVEHNGTVPVWWLVSSREMKEITDGGYVLGYQPGHGISLDEEKIATLGGDPSWRPIADRQIRPARAALRLTPEDDSQVDT